MTAISPSPVSTVPASRIIFAPSIPDVAPASIPVQAAPLPVNTNDNQTAATTPPPANTGTAPSAVYTALANASTSIIRGSSVNTTV